MSLILALLSGTTRVTSRQANALLTKKRSLELSTLLNYLTGLMIAVLVFSLMPKGSFNGTIPWWSLLGGLIGIISVSQSSTLSLKMPQLSFSLCLLAGQLLGSLIIDSLLLKPLGLLRIIGLGLIVAAATLQAFSRRSA